MPFISGYVRIIPKPKYSFFLVCAHFENDVGNFIIVAYNMSHFYCSICKTLDTAPSWSTLYPTLRSIVNEYISFRAPPMVSAHVSSPRYRLTHCPSRLASSKAAAAWCYSTFVRWTRYELPQEWFCHETERDEITIFVFIICYRMYFVWRIKVFNVTENKSVWP